MPTGSMTWQHWELGSQAKLDECADYLYDEAGIDCDTRRGHDVKGNPLRRLQINLPTAAGPVEAFVVDPDPMHAVFIAGVVQVMTAAEYTASPFYEAP